MIEYVQRKDVNAYCWKRAPHAMDWRVTWEMRGRATERAYIICQRYNAMATVSQGLTALLLTSLSPLTTELLVPAMLYMGRDASEESVALYFSVIAILHLIHGAFMKKAGSTCMASYGCVVYAASSVAMARWKLAGGEFQMGRAAQAVGASACTVAGYGRIKERMRPRRHIPLLNSLRSLLLVLAPMASQAAVDRYGWRSVFSLMAILPLIALSLLLCESQERGGGGGERIRGGGGGGEREGGREGYDLRLFLTWTSADSLGFAAMIVWVAYAPFLVEEENGYLYGVTFLGSFFGPFLTYALPKKKRRNTLFVASSLLATASMLVEEKYTGMLLMNTFRSCSFTISQAEALLSSPAGGSPVQSLRMAAASAAILISISAPPERVMISFSAASSVCGALILLLQK